VDLVSHKERRVESVLGRQSGLEPGGAMDASRRWSNQTCKNKIENTRPNHTFRLPFEQLELTVFGYTLRREL